MDEGIGHYHEAVRLKPDDPGILNSLAWFHATSPEPKWRDPEKAVEFAMKAVQFAPDNAGYFNTLGVAQYRAADWHAARKALTESMQLSDGGDCVDWYFLAMTHWQLDERVEARVLYDKASAWMSKNDPKSAELIRFRAETAELLGEEDVQNPTKETLADPDAN